MLKDVSIGQYFPGNSIIHRTDPRVKLILTMVFIIMLFFVKNPLGFIVPIIYLLLVIKIAKLSLTVILKSVKPIIPLILFSSLLNMFFLDGDPLFEFFGFGVSKQGVTIAILMTVRIICLIIGSSLLTYTTSPIALTDAIERLMKPLKKVNFPVHEIAMMMTIALRFIPTLIDETDKIISAQKARGADMETGNAMQRMKSLIPILIPLFISAFRRAEELALAMECRCYAGGEGRTRMRQLKLSGLDFLSTSFMIITFIATITFDKFLEMGF